MERNPKISTTRLGRGREQALSSSAPNAGRHGRRRDRRTRTLPSAKRQERKKIAAKHIQFLIDLALEEAKNNSKLAARYADIAWNISTRFNVRLKEKRGYFCRFCKAFLAVPGGARYRLSKKRKSLNITCTTCGKTYRKMIARHEDIKRAING